MLENNYRYTRTLAEWCLARDVRFIYASSAATYGDGSHGYCDRDEIAPRLRPLNQYGYSKQLFDLWALRTGAIKKIVGLKFFNVFGPNEYHKGDMSSVVFKAFHQVRSTGRVELFKSYHPDFADGGQQRDFIYVKDCVEVIAWLMQNRIGGLYNLGTGQAQNLERPDAGRVHRARQAAADRLHRNAPGLARPVPVLHPGGHDAILKHRLPGPLSQPGRRGPGLRGELPAGCEPVSHGPLSVGTFGFRVMANSHLVFVYGSLKRGEHNHGLLRAAEYRGEARTGQQFRLYAFRDYPALVRDENDPQAIAGEIYAVDEATLRLLDRLEDNGRLYQRVMIDVDSLQRPNERLRAWVYLFLGELHGASPWTNERWSGSSGPSAG